MRVAFQMDPIGGVDIEADSSFRLAEAAQDRGHKLYFYTPEDLIWRDGRVSADGQSMEVRRLRGDH
ncbi:MAG: glutathione synthase, partial [Pseudomonadota bacterium]